MKKLNHYWCDVCKTGGLSTKHYEKCDTCGTVEKWYINGISVKNIMSKPKTKKKKLKDVKRKHVN